MQFTVVDGVGRTSHLFQEETSGLIMPATVTLDMAAVLVNDPVYGLAAEVDTNGSRKAIKVAYGIRAGGVMPNCFGEGDVTSSFGGRDKTRWAHEHHTEIKPSGSSPGTDMKNTNKATLIGLLAVLLWSAIVGLIRSVSVHLGATGGAAMMYSVASVFLLLSVGHVRLAGFPRRYLVWGSLLFVSYELCLSLSIGYANTARQAIEVGMVNYLWPTFTIVAAILFNGQRANFLIVPGVVLSVVGICRVLGGAQGFDAAGMLENMGDNPLSYGLAFAGAVIWAAYCTVTARIAQGTNGVTLFFILVSASLWIKYLLGGGGQMHFSLEAVVYLVLAAAAMGFGYAAWNVGILHGKVTLLAGASYFIPVFSAALSSLLLQAPLSWAFWQGTAMVTGGAILCWLSTRARRTSEVAA